MPLYPVIWPWDGVLLMETGSKLCGEDAVL